MTKCQGRITTCREISRRKRDTYWPSTLLIYRIYKFIQSKSIFTGGMQLSILCQISCIGLSRFQKTYNIRCCYELNKWDEGERLLISSLQCDIYSDRLFQTSQKSTGKGKIQQTIVNGVPNGAAGLQLLGNIKERQGKPDCATKCYTYCLNEAPFLVEVYDRLSWLTRDYTYLAIIITMSMRIFVQSLVLDVNVQYKYNLQYRHQTEISNLVCQVHGRPPRQQCLVQSAIQFGRRRWREP